MENRQRNQIVYRWTILSALLAAAFWGSWWFIFGWEAIPVVDKIQIIPGLIIHLPWGISRLTDVVFTPIWVFLFVWVFGRERSADYEDMIFGVVVSIIFGVSISVASIVSGGLGIVIMLGLIFNAMFGLGLGLVLKIFQMKHKVGFSEPVVSMINLGLGLGFGLVAGLAVGLALSLIFFTVFRFAHLILKEEVWQDFGRWLAAKENQNHL